MRVVLDWGGLFLLSGQRLLVASGSCLPWESHDHSIPSPSLFSPLLFLLPCLMPGLVSCQLFAAFCALNAA